MQTPTIRQLRTFLAVCEAGSVSAAAHSLGLSQPAASQQLRELERILGVRLLERSNGRAIPTLAGRALLDPARRTVAAAEDTVALAAASRSGDAGRLRLGTGVTGCIYVLPPVLSALKREMPGLTITVTIGDAADIVPRVEAGELDVGHVTLPVGLSRSLSATHLYSEPLVALIPDAIAPPGRTIAARELASLPLISYPHIGLTRTIIDAWFRAAGVAQEPIMEIGNFEAIKPLVSVGLGAAIVPAIAVASGVAGTVIRQLRPALVRQVGYVVRRGKILDRPTRTLIGELGKAVGTMGFS
ncbi:LysR family transcriptional regulator [Inquilinus sp.]|uniref:LysR family transcriptional regulator n=1 Tax=Inquilinus sp. TaxID=1932117 RepID=UPI0031D63A49